MRFRSTGTPARFNRARSLVQLSGRKRRNATITGTSSRASVSDTSVWQLAFLPSAEAYCQATPTECLPFLAPRCHRLPTLHRCRRRVCPLGRAVPSLTALRPRRQQRQNGAIDHSRQVHITSSPDPDCSNAPPRRHKARRRRAVATQSQCRYRTAFRGKPTTGPRRDRPHPHPLAKQTYCTRYAGAAC